jgi:hypothetical protein
MEIARVTVPFDVQRTAENVTRRGGHWSARSRVMRLARELARLCWLDAGRPKAAGKVRVSVVIRRARALDTANAIGALKPLLDGLFVDAITPQDSPKWLEFGGCTQETAKEWKGREEVTFIVEDAREAAPWPL